MINPRRRRETLFVVLLVSGFVVIVRIVHQHGPAILLAIVAVAICVGAVFVYVHRVDADELRAVFDRVEELRGAWTIINLSACIQMPTFERRE
ncbi:hypothetical protein C9J85_05465 [Haloferax sp. wsp5]|nr:hypothetical protein C9J85_05465 [Haloferax sp. wsp5]